MNLVDIVQEEMGTFLFIDMSLMTVQWTMDLAELYFLAKTGQLTSSMGSGVSVLGGLVRVFILTNASEKFTMLVDNIVDKLEDIKITEDNDRKEVISE